jgi:GTPase SAR1 family protein
MNEPLETLESIIREHEGRSLNEADTRHKVIDYIIHNVLSWPRNRVSLEEHIHGGYADYVFKKANGEDLLFIEAKKEGAFFELPIPHKPGETSCFIQINKLLTDKNIKAAITQVRTYCFDSGCEFACITNGHEWIFFKSFEKGKKWESLQAFVIRRLSYFSTEYTKAVNNFSFTAINEHATLPTLLNSSHPKDRGIFFPKEKIPSYSHTITANRLAASLRPIASYYFGVITDHDTEFMERCYVSQRDYQSTHEGMRSIIHDSLSPYLESHNIQQLDGTGKGGRLGGKLTKNLKHKKQGDVLVLFGGKGAGKSTFIKRLLHHNPPRWLKDHAVISIVDLLKVPEEKAVIRDVIWDSLIKGIDTEQVLDSPRHELINTLFKDRFGVALKQDLSGLSDQSEAFNLKLNELVAKWKLDKKYCAKKIVEYWREKDKGIIVVVDNTDQYSTVVQDFCFSSAQEVSKELDCTTLISMREERFYNSKIHGVLDAFQNSRFHISSPRPAEVFKKRLEYTASLLQDDAKREAIIGDQDNKFVADCCTYLDILNKTFSNDMSPLNSFLSACAHGDIRLSLDLFRSFLLSGYTNVDEMILAKTWNFQIHQVIKPVMIPTRYFYDENLSDIPNIYQLRSNRNSSHFTALRILRKLAKTIESSTPCYLSIAELRSYFAETFNMLEDFEKNIDVLLKHGFVESNNRLDQYSESVDSVKITNYGLYMINELAFFFAYLDLVCTDCGIYSEQTSNYLTEAAKKEYNLFTKGDRISRVQVRLERVEEFIKYLKAEEDREKDFYSLGMPEEEMFTFKASENFIPEKERVLKSAAKQKPSQTTASKPFNRRPKRR